MELPHEDKKKQYDFVSSLASKALDVDSRSPAGKLVEDAERKLKEAKQAGDARYANETNRAVEIANNVQQSLSPDEKEAAAAGLDGAKKLIKEYRSLKGFTYRDLLDAGGYNKEVEPKSMGNAELMTRLSMAILPALAGYAVGKMGGMSNPYIPAAGAAEAGVKGLQYLDQLDKEKRDRAAKQKEMQAKAAMSEAGDERKMMREALLMPQKERLRAQELAAQFKLTVGKEAADAALKGRVATDEEKQAEYALREAKRMEFDADQKAKDRELNKEQRELDRKQRELDRAAKLKAAGMKKAAEKGEPDLGEGFVMNPGKQWTSKDREQAQKVVSAYSEHNQAIAELKQAIREGGKWAAVPGTEARDRVIQATSKYIDSYRAWKGTGANYTEKEMKLAGETGIDPRSSISWDNIRLIQKPELLLERLDTLQESARRATQNKIGAYSATDTVKMRPAKDAPPPAKNDAKTERQKRIEQLKKELGK